MGSAARTSSASSQAGYEEAKELMETLVESGQAQDAVDIGATAALAAYPNGGSLYAMYTFSKYAVKFLDESQQNGVESGIKEVGKDVVTSEVAGEGAEEVVTEAQDTVTQAAHNEIMRRGVDEANKNLSEPAQRAATAAISSIVSQGGDALAGVEPKDEQREK